MRCWNGQRVGIEGHIIAIFILVSKLPIWLSFFAARTADLDRRQYFGGLFWSANLTPQRVHLFPPPMLSKCELSMCRRLREMGGGVDDVHCLKPGNLRPQDEQLESR